MDRDFLIRIGREVPAFGRGRADEDCESGYPPRHPRRHCQVQDVFKVSVCVVNLHICRCDL